MEINDPSLGIHSVEKIGGTSMSQYQAVRDNIIFSPEKKGNLYNRVFVVSAYGGITNRLLEHKKTGRPGVYALFATAKEEGSWQEALSELRQEFHRINGDLFQDSALLEQANAFIDQRLNRTERTLMDLQSLCSHGHFSLQQHLDTVREMLASIGEAHSAWNTAELLRQEGVNTLFVDLTGWQNQSHISLDQRIKLAFEGIDLNLTMPIATGYAHSETGLMATFDRGYSEMTFSRIAVLTGAREAIIHKEFHLSSADPRLVGEENAVPIGRTNYEVADHLANLGMEAIHPKAAKGLRQNEIPLRVKNTFEPDHHGTVITSDYKSVKPMVEIIAGRKDIYAVEIFDQEMAGNVAAYEQKILPLLRKLNIYSVSKDINANTITHYISASLKKVNRLRHLLQEEFPEAELDQQKVSLVSVLGSDMDEPGMLAKAVEALAREDISIMALNQSKRQVDIQFVISEKWFNQAIKALHRALVEVHNHEVAVAFSC